jgi:hypothetical protein
VDRLHGASAQTDCPGALKCVEWGWLKECKECPRATAGRPPRTVDLAFEEAGSAHIERLVAERRCGLGSAELDEAERELLIVWEMRERGYERRHMQHVGDVAAFVRAFLKRADGQADDQREAFESVSHTPDMLAKLQQGPKQMGRAERSDPSFTKDGLIELERVGWV